MSEHNEECWSDDEECFNYQCLQDLLDCNDHLEAGDVVWVGKACKPSVSHLISVDRFIDDMKDSAYDVAGEYAEDFANDVSAEAIKELEDYLRDWVEKNCAITFYTVKEVKEYVLTEEDFK